MRISQLFVKHILNKTCRTNAERLPAASVRQSDTKPYGLKIDPGKKRTGPCSHTRRARGSVSASHALPGRFQGHRRARTRVPPLGPGTVPLDFLTGVTSAAWCNLCRSAVSQGRRDDGQSFVGRGRGLLAMTPARLRGRQRAVQAPMAATSPRTGVQERPAGVAPWFCIDL